MVRGSGCNAPRAWFPRRLTRSLAQAPLPRQAGHLPIFLALLRRPLSGHRAQGGPPPPLPRSTRTGGRPRIFGGRRHCRPLAAARRRHPPPRRRRRRRVGSCAARAGGTNPRGRSVTCRPQGAVPQASPAQQRPSEDMVAVAAPPPPYPGAPHAAAQGPAPSSPSSPGRRTSHRGDTGAHAGGHYTEQRARMRTVEGTHRTAMQSPELGELTFRPRLLGHASGPDSAAARLSFDERMAAAEHRRQLHIVHLKQAMWEKEEGLRRREVTMSSRVRSSPPSCSSLHAPAPHAPPAPHTTTSGARRAASSSLGGASGPSPAQNSTTACTRLVQ